MRTRNTLARPLLAPLAGLCLGILGLSTASARERIVSFDSDITVHTDAAMTVTETITVVAEGDRIRRGIFRDFPTRYRDRTGNRFVVAFDVLDVKRNGRKEPYRVEPLGNGKRVRIGDADVFLEPGRHTYAITYRTDFQIGYFETHDELYWNVTGNGWEFDIERASATVTLPEGVDREDIHVEAYTGPQGAVGQDYRTAFVNGDRPYVETTRALDWGEGLTIVVTWPKGIVYEPTVAERWQRMLDANTSAFAALVGLACLIGYYFTVWLLVGKDPDEGVIIPLYHPPDDISPGAARYLMEMGYDHKCLAAAMIDLGVKGRMTLKERNGVYTAHKVKGATADGLQPEQAKLFKALFGTRMRLKFKQTNHRSIGKMVKTYRKALALAYEKTHFRTNRSYWIPGILIVFGTLAAVIATSESPGEAVFMGIWLTFWSLGVVALGFAVIGAWSTLIRGPGRITAGIGALFITAFSVPFFIAEGFGAWQLARVTSPLAVGILILMALILVQFYHLMKAPTYLGRKVMDGLDGFKKYLSVAEEDRLAYMHPPNRTPELFERYLPYALALDVEQEWAEYFADVLADAALRGEPSASSGAGGWYQSSSGHALGTAAFAGAVGGALASAISSSATAPGSSGGSSGSGGGGSSGGGGGGGGGGGW